jgi:predicted enzyme related to lactoylglutathione lyase
LPRDAAQCRFNHAENAMRRGTGVAALLVLIAGATLGCQSTKPPPEFEALAIVSGPTSVERFGQFVWYELLTTDIDAARKFYGELFGWSFRTVGPDALILHEGRRIGGILQVREETEEDEARWIPTLSVEDVDAAAKAIVENGGAILEGPDEMEPRGAFAVVADPSGAPFVILRSEAGDPAIVRARPGSFLWTELWTPDPRAVGGFYQTLAGWKYLPVGPVAKATSWVAHRDGRWTAGLTPMPWNGVEAQWVPSILVGNPAGTAARAKELGGRVLVEPGKAPSDGSAALIADPSGAAFVVERWPAGRGRSR